MPTDSTDTKVLPVVPDIEEIGFPLRQSVIEVSLRPLGVRVGRVRLPVRAGELAVTGQPPAATIRVELLARPGRSGSPAGRLLRGGTLTCVAADLILGSGVVEGAVDIGGVTWSLPLTARVVAFEDSAIVLVVRGPIRPHRTVKGWRRWLWAEAALEFTR